MQFFISIQRKAFLILAFFFFILASNSTFATHAVGVDLAYECLGGNQYRFIVTLYRDCSGTTAPTGLSVAIESASCGISTSASLDLESTTEVSQICANDIPNTTCNGGNMPGIEQYIYSGTFTLPQECNDWVSSYTLCCRNNAITNLQSPGSQNIYVEAKIDNVGGKCNSSSQFTSLPTPYICVNQQFSYNHSAVDPDGHTLVYSLVDPLNDSNDPIAHEAPFNATSPLSDGGTLNFDTNTGQMVFTPDQIQQSVVSILVDEYDAGGVWMGSTMRDLQVVVLNCNNTPPTATGVDSSSTVFNYDVCTGTQFCFDIHTSDDDAGQNTTMNWNAGIPGATFTVAGITNQVGTFCWTPQNGDVGSHYFTVTVEDDACQIPGINTYTYEVIVTQGSDPDPDAGTDQIVCEGDAVTLAGTAGAGATYDWAPANGLSCTNCASPSLTANNDNIYTFTATYPSGCVKTDQVQVTVEDDPTVNILPQDVSICSGSSVALTANTDAANTLLWTTGETATTITPAPGATTSFVVTATNPVGCESTATANVTVSPPPPTEVCNNLYVTTNGTGTGDSPSDPTDLLSALGMAQCNSATIKMAIGTYTIDNAITEILGYTTIEGGYDPGNNWTKSSLAGATTIFRSNLNPEGTVGAQRLVAVYMSNASYFRFQDVTIEVADATGNGMSTYAMHMTSCSNYEIVRCQFIAGNATDGLDGVAGTVIAGSGGAGGTGGAMGEDCDSGTDGVAGTDGLGGTTGGTLGGAGISNGCNWAGCGAEEINGNNGGNGANGVDGTTWNAGDKPLVTIGTYFEPILAIDHGGDGTAGAGGGGGGGAAIGTSCTCGDGTGDAFGGAGGNGGDAGTGGTAASGGGASFGVFTFNNISGEFIDCDIQTGAAGAGGVGGAGTTGAAGVAGSVGGSHDRCDGSVGGSGGDGGNGGNGGRGRDGSDGIASKFYLNGTAPTFTNSGTPITLSTGENTPSDFGLAAQSVINVDNRSCTNVDVTFSSGASGNWNLDGTSTNQTPTGTSVINQYSDVSRKDIQFNGDNYSGFLNITLDGVQVPDLNTTATQLNADTFVICTGNSADFWTTTTIANAFDWDFGGAATPNTYTTANVVGVTFNTPGTYDIELTISTDCCGPASPVTVVLIVEEEPSIVITGNLDYCEGETTTLTVATPSDSVIWSPDVALNTPFGTTVTFSPSVSSNYIVTAYSPNRLCTNTEDVDIVVNELPEITPSSTPVSCMNDGTATATVGNLAGPFNYQWNDATNQTVNPATNLYSGNYMVLVTDQATGCADSAFAFVSSGVSPLVYISNSINVSCYQGNDGEATAAVSNGTAPFTYTWTNINLGTTVATGAGINTVTGLSAGDYNVSVVDNNNCITTVDFGISQPDTSVYIFDADTINGGCSGSTVGSITIYADGGVGGFTYLWDANANSQTTATATGLPLGDFDVTVMDGNGCETVGTYGVIQPPPLTVTASVTDAICNGGNSGTATAIPQNGGNPFTYFWDTNANNQSTQTATGLAAGIYTVTATDISLCSDVVSVTVEEPIPMVSTVQSTSATCSLADGSASITVTQGTAPYSYLWDANANNQITQTATAIVTGVFDVTVVDVNLCELSTSVSVGNTSPPMTTNLFVSSTNCSYSSDGSGTVTPTSGTSPYTYLWEDGQTNSTANNLTAGPHSVTITDNSGCFGYATVSVTSPSVITLSTSTTDENCTAQDGTASVAATGGTGTNYTYAWSNGVNTALASNLDNVDYTVNVTDENSCIATTTVTVGNTTLTLALTTTVTDVNCNNGTDGAVSVNAINGTSPYTYNWSFGDVTSSVSGLSALAASVTVTDNLGCSNSENVTVNQPSALSITGTTTNVSCFTGSDGEVSISALGGTPPYDVVWFNGATNNSVSALPSGTYSVTINDGNGCTITDSYTLTEPTQLGVNTTSTNPECNGYCTGVSTALGTGGISLYAYSWSNGQNGATSNGLCAGNYSVTVTDDNGCTAISGTTLTEPTAVTTTFQATDATCNNVCDGLAVVVADGGTGIKSYQWSSPIATTNPLALNLCSGIYQLSVTDANGCSAPVETFTINEPPALVITNTSTISTNCEQNDGSASIDNIVGGLGSGYSYQWGNNQTTTTATGLLAGEYCVTVHDAASTAPNGCYTSTCVTVSNIEGPSITAWATAAMCSGECNGTAEALATANGGSNIFSYQWAANANSQQGSVANNLCSGQYTVTVTDANGCVAITITEVTEPIPVEVVTSVTNGVVCYNECTNISAIATGGNGAPYSYQWNIGNGQLQMVCPTQQYTFYEVTATDALGCPSIANYIMVEMTPPIEGFALGDNTICEDGDTYINAIGAEGNGGPYTYVWSSGQTGGTINVSPSNYPTPEMYIVTISDGCSPSISDTVIIDYYPTPAPLFSPDSFAGCVPYTTTIQPFLNTLSNVNTCLWEMEDGSTYEGCNLIEHEFVEIGSHDVTLSVISNDGCGGIYTWANAIQVHGLPEADFISNPNPTNMLNTQVDFEDRSDEFYGAIAEWNWTYYNNDQQTVLGIGNGYYGNYTFPSDTGHFPVNLHVENVHGCEDDTTKFVEIEGIYEIYVPNAFTPNGNGLNDFFYPTGVGIASDPYKLEIYDRWGERIYESLTPTEGWDGVAHEKGGSGIAQDGVYVWKLYTKEALTTNKKDHTYVGTVTLIR